MKKLTLGVLLFLLGFSLVSGQKNPDPLGSWTILNIRGKITGKWEFFYEGQARSIGLYNKFYYYESPKGGINYNIFKDLSVTVGAGSYNTYKEGGNFERPMSQREIRVWQQLTTKSSYGLLKMEHRYRMEQRFTSNGYRNRYRYRFTSALPINSKEFKKGTLFSIIWTELFLTNRKPYFERTRLFGGLGYQFTEVFTLQAGWINQYDYSLKGDQNRDFIQATLIFDLDLKSAFGRLPVGEF
ncbi:MAG TPA: DUF2490 domain-containing protein [Bacteroidia bacterium]|nr:DUF2490 domain-containing protein [Bacteroidia bacterium]